MALLQESDRKVLEEKFTELQKPVKLVVFTQEMECQYCKETRQLAEEVAALSDLISLEVYDFVKHQEIAEQYNVDNYSSTRNYTCLKCGGALLLPDKLSTASVAGTVVDDEAEKGKIDDMFTGKEIQGCKIIQRLGEGGMGAVYKAKDVALNRLVAVKYNRSPSWATCTRRCSCARPAPPRSLSTPTWSRSTPRESMQAAIT